MNGTKFAALTIAPLVVLVTVMIVVLGGAEAQQNAAAATCPASLPANNPTTTTTVPGSAGSAPAAGATTTTTTAPAAPACGEQLAGCGQRRLPGPRLQPIERPDDHGPEHLNESQLADWYGPTHPQTVNGVPIGQVITQYLTDGQAEGVRGDIASSRYRHVATMDRHSVNESRGGVGMVRGGRCATAGGRRRTRSTSPESAIPARGSPSHRHCH